MNRKNLLLYFSPNLMLLAALIFAGSFGYMLIEKADFFTSFYMAVITLSTVGFSEIVPLTSAGRAFTILLIFAGGGVFAYTLGKISGMIAEGEIWKHFQIYRMEKNIQRLRDHIIVVGFGEVGRDVAAKLMKRGKSIAVVSHAEDFVDLEDFPDFLRLEGVADDETLRKAGIEHAKVIIITTKNDTTNVYVTLTAHALNPNIEILSRVSKATDAPLLKRAGAHLTVVVPNITSEAMVAAAID